MKYLFWILGLACLLASCGDGKTYVEIETKHGVMKAVLYDETPIHKENFIKLANEGFYDSLLFHRVISGFMIQGGDPQSYNAPQGKRLGGGGPGYKLDPEIGLPHFKGCLAAARQPDSVNPERKSSGSQFYIVHGTPQTDATLEQMERRKGFQYSEAQKFIYKKNGGAPQLDGDYTVFGELVSGLEIVDKIASHRLNGERPKEDVIMKVRVVR